MGFIGNVVDAYLRSRGYRKSGERPTFFEAEAQTGLWSLGDWNRRTDEDLAMKVSWVYSDINMIARECSQAGLGVVKEQGEETEEISNHPFEVLMRRPNPFMSRSFLMQYTVGWLKLDGNAYWLLIPGGDGLAEIWPLPASKMEPIPSKDRNKFLDGYAYEVQGRKHTIPIEFVAHFRQWNHQNIYKGMSDIQAIRLAIKTDNAMQTWNWNFFGEKNAIPTTLISLPQDTSPGDFEMIKEEIVNELRATQRRTAVARAGDLSVQAIGLAQRDIDYLAGREFTREEIDRVYGIPAGLWAKDSTRANAEAADKTFKEKTIWPMLVYMGEEISAQVLWRWYGEDLVADFEDIRPQDRILTVQEAKTYGPAQTVDEFRQRYLSLGPLEDERGEILMAELVKGPAMPSGGSAVPEKSANLKAELKRWRSVAVRMLKSGEDPGEYDFGSNLIPGGLKSRVVEALRAAKSEEEVKAAFAAPFRLLEPGGLKGWKGESSPYEKLRKAWEAKAAQALLAVWTKEAKRLLEHFQQRAQVKTWPVKALAEDILGDEPFWNEQVRVQISVVLPLLEEAIEQAGRLGIGLLDTELGLGIDWALVNEEALRWAREYAGSQITLITETTRQAIGETVANWIQTGEPVSELRKRIQTIYEDRVRAQLIATTEATDAYTQGNRLVWKKTEVVDGYEWRTANDELVCVHICKPLHKQRRTVDQPYIIPSGKLQGETKDGPSGHPGCRCWEAPVVMEA